MVAVLNEKERKTVRQKTSTKNGTESQNKPVEQVTARRTRAAVGRRVLLEVLQLLLDALQCRRHCVCRNNNNKKRGGKSVNQTLQKQSCWRNHKNPVLVAPFSPMPYRLQVFFLSLLPTPVDNDVAPSSNAVPVFLRCFCPCLFAPPSAVCRCPPPPHAVRGACVCVASTHGSHKKPPLFFLALFFLFSD